MTEQEINYAIAKECGTLVLGSNELEDGYYPYKLNEDKTPNYCRDSNAMHEAWKTLSTMQQAEAFLKIIGKWKD